MLGPLPQFSAYLNKPAVRTIAYKSSIATITLGVCLSVDVCIYVAIKQRAIKLLLSIAQGLI